MPLRASVDVQRELHAIDEAMCHMALLPSLLCRKTNLQEVLLERENRALARRVLNVAW